jgi:hypothetical protein
MVVFTVDISRRMMELRGTSLDLVAFGVEADIDS